MKKETIFISTEYLTLGQLIKYVGLIDSGCEAKEYLATHTIWVNGEPENRRGKKLYPNTTIEIKDLGIYVIEKDS